MPPPTTPLGSLLPKRGPRMRSICSRVSVTSPASSWTSSSLSSARILSRVDETKRRRARYGLVRATAGLPRTWQCLPLLVTKRTEPLARENAKGGRGVVLYVGQKLLDRCPGEDRVFEVVEPRDVRDVLRP